MQTVDPELMIHPLRKTLNEQEIVQIIQRVEADDTTVTLEECDAALDWLYDYAVQHTQTVAGTTVIQ